MAKLVFFDSEPEDTQFFHDVLKDDDVVCLNEGVSPESLPAAVDAEVVSMHVSSKLSDKDMAAIPGLKHVALRSTGFDNVDHDAAARRGVTVTNVPSYGEHTVAEFAFTLMLAVTRGLPRAMAAVDEGVIHPRELTGHDLYGKKLGVVGTGRIGRRTIEIAKGFGMEVVAFDPFPNEQAAKDMKFEYLPLTQLMREADVITLHAPATADNEHLINDKLLGTVKPGAILINTARGSLVDTAALISALRTGRLAGAGIDVVEGEQFMEIEEELHLLTKPRRNRDEQAALRVEILKSLPNVVLTSHNAFNTVEALQRIRQTTADNIKAFRSGAPTNVVKPKPVH